MQSIRSSSLTSSPSTTKAIQIILATAILSLDGAFFSLAVFSEPVGKASGVKGALDDVWSGAMSLMSIVSIPFMLLAGKYLSEGQVPSKSTHLTFGKSKTARLRILGLLSAFCISLLFLAAWGITTGNYFLVAFAVGIQGIPLNIYFLISLELLAEWMPSRPGLAVGCGQTAFGLGIMIFSGVFENFITRFGCINAVRLCSALLMFSGGLLCGLLKWPPLEHNPNQNSLTEGNDLEQKVKTLSLKQLLSVPTFWICVFAIMTSQIGFVFIAYFFKVGLTFNMQMHSLVQVFEVISLISAFSRPLTGMLADSLKWGQGFFSIGSKNVMIIITAAEALLFCLLIPISNLQSFTGFVLATGFIVVTFATSECITALLLRDIFGSENSSLAFGAGVSIGFGFGCFIPPLILEVVSLRGDINPLPSTYNSFYLICVVWSILGCLASILLVKYKPVEERYTEVKPFPITGVSEAEKGLLGRAVPPIYGAVIYPGDVS